jgi:hypothetical protein
MINHLLSTEKTKSLLPLFIMSLGFIFLCTGCLLGKDPKIPHNNVVRLQANQAEGFAAHTSVAGEAAAAITAQEERIEESRLDNAEIIFERWVERRTPHNQEIGKEETSDPKQKQCPVCLMWFDQHEEAAAPYWSCHFVCKVCGEQMKNKGCNMACPLCRAKPK